MCKLDLNLAGSSPILTYTNYMPVMLGVEYLNLGHLIDSTLRYLATPLLKFSVDQ